MQFLTIPKSEIQVDDLLVHSLKMDQVSFKKGRFLSEDDIQKINSLHIDSLSIARLEQTDLHEDQAANKIAQSVQLTNIRITESFTGRVNFIAETTGLLSFDATEIIALNMIDPAITLATIPNHTIVEAGQLLATIKIIPFAVSISSVKKAQEKAKELNFSLNIFQNKRIALIQTTLPHVNEKILKKTTQTLAKRLQKLNDNIIATEYNIPHATNELCNQLKSTIHDHDLIIITGASAITDIRDTIPTAIQQAGGSIIQYGMPVDPGNLLLLAELHHKKIITMPGCARSIKLNGFDWVLERLLADIELRPEDFANMAVGGLLKEIPTRPSPRLTVNSQKNHAKAPKVAAIILAAGQSRRMGTENKLLLPFKGKPLLTHMLTNITESSITDLSIILGYENDKVQKILHHPHTNKISLNIIHNKDYETGIASSIKAGVVKLAPDIDAVLICQGDMPFITADILNKIVAAYSEEDNREICIPTYQGKWGNPILIGKRFFANLLELTGDIGAKPILNDYEEYICEVNVHNTAIFKDADTKEKLQQLEQE